MYKSTCYSKLKWDGMLHICLLYGNYPHAGFSHTVAENKKHSDLAPFQGALDQVSWPGIESDLFF